MDVGYTGRCLCGAIRFAIAGPIEPPVACHCRECQRHSGGVWIAVTAPVESVEITRERLAWVSITPMVRRGFCLDCGGYLFWQRLGEPTIDIALGALDDPLHLTLAAHIHTKEARTPIPEDGVPRFEAGMPGDIATDG
ncbi:MAG: GFA family protein [Pseudomonadota bacterium]